MRISLHKAAIVRSEIIALMVALLSTAALMSAQIYCHNTFYSQSDIISERAVTAQNPYYSWNTPSEPSGKGERDLP